MLSLKDNVRRAITLTIVSALATTIFVGCAKQEPADINSGASSSSITTELTPSMVDELTPGLIESGDVDAFSIKYQYWYENTDITEMQSNSLAATVTDAIALTGTHFFDIEGMPIRTDSNGNEYVISGRTPVYLADGKLAPDVLFKGLREEATGILHYFNVVASTDEFETALDAGGYTQSKNYTDRVINDAEPEVSSELYEVYLNNITTGYTYDRFTLLDVTSIISSYNRGQFSSDDSTLTLYTAAGDLKIAFIVNNGILTLKYSGVDGVEEKSVVLNNYEDMIAVGANGIGMSLPAIERYLGYEVEVYDEGDSPCFINIVTDNKDIATKETLHSESVMPVIDESLVGTDPSEPMSTPDNQEIINSNLEEFFEDAPTTTPTEETPTKSTEEPPVNTTPSKPAEETTPAVTRSIEELKTIPKSEWTVEESDRMALDAMQHPEDNRDFGHTEEELKDILDDFFGPRT